ncbi:MAG: ribonuclease J [Candidatus Colwellbacteria bacterium]|nr:ribonuclease J [Candidatus Colwellbacteria bacterium]
MKSKHEDTVRLIPLGGLEEVGRNMAYIEYKDEIVIIDMGIQFPEEATPGVDFIIPNIESLIPKRENIRAVVLTHGHFDHVGAIPYLMGKLGNPRIYTTKLTKALIEKRQEDFVNAPKLKIEVINVWDKVKVGDHIELEFFGVYHTVPDTVGVVVKTPAANIAHYADFRIEYDAKGNAQDLDVFERVSKLDIHTFMVDSTNAEEEGRTVSEKIVEQNLEELFKAAKGRVILSTFSTMLTRIAEIIKICERLGRKVIINGRSMKEAIQIARNLGYMKVKKETIVGVEDMKKLKDNQIMIITTGAQGQENAGLSRIVNGEHKHITIKPGDTMIFSSSVIPGNERSVQNLKDNLTRQGAIVHTSKVIDIHSSGHAPADDLTMTIKLTKPKFVVPVHGYYFMRSANGQNAVKAGVPAENIRLMDNGQVAILSKDKFEITKETVPANYVMVDGLGVGDVGEIVLRDRRILAQEGMVVVITTIDRRTGKLLKNPDIISRGFIYLKENQDLLNEVRKKIRTLVGKIPRKQSPDIDYLKNIFRDQIGQFLYNKTFRRPMVLPVIIEI